MGGGRHINPMADQVGRLWAKRVSSQVVDQSVAHGRGEQLAWWRTWDPCQSGSLYLAQGEPPEVHD